MRAAKRDAWLLSRSLCLRVVFPAKPQNFPRLLGAFPHAGENTGSKGRQKNTKTTRNWHGELKAYLKLRAEGTASACITPLKIIKNCNFEHQRNNIWPRTGHRSYCTGQAVCLKVENTERHVRAPPAAQSHGESLRGAGFNSPSQI